MTTAAKMIEAILHGRIFSPKSFLGRNISREITKTIIITPIKRDFCCLSDNELISISLLADQMDERAKLST